MRQLTRGPAPAVLGQLRRSQDRWDDIGYVARSQVWQALAAMQGSLCAYCERRAEQGSGHIEHFRTRNLAPQLTYEWTNLFGCCSDTTTCGHRKDSRQAQPYDASDLIKPDQEDPDVYFLFVSDGSITVREGLSERQSRRARETLRVLALDQPGGGLRWQRRNALAAYMQLADEWAQLADAASPQEVRELLEAEVQSAEDQEFVTAIRHLLLGPRGAPA